jgi:cyclopropane fatty-acyl-phospholipid synthase-like methyltransferase
LTTVKGVYEIRELKTIGLDYSRTLAQWNDRLSAGRADLESRYGHARFEHFELYFETTVPHFRKRDNLCFCPERSHPAFAAPAVPRCLRLSPQWRRHP